MVLSAYATGIALTFRIFMKIALIGYGGMGKAVERAAVERGHTIISIVDAATGKPLSEAAFKGADVAIDFSNKEAVMDVARTCIAAGVPLVEGTTGWYDHVDEMRTMVEKSPSIGYLWSSNFSIGVQLYFKIVTAAAKLMNHAEEYDVWGHEIHHTGKADSPSGTAKSLEKILLDAMSRKTSVVEDKLDRKREDSEIHFSSVRGGPVNFGHTIGFDSAADRILITHEARNRDGYALGAVKAAEWLAGKKGFYGMDDFMRDMFPDA